MTITGNQATYTPNASYTGSDSFTFKVNDGSVDSNASTVTLTIEYLDGTACDDGNVQTINDIYTSNICSGTNVEGDTCDDGYTQTSPDTYHNGVCIGGPTIVPFLSN